ncbi:amidase [Dongia rigui]|uniref:Amidase n=1 Tax=Dongia rigui TaxID=940149 RepID=A0ABU5DZ64_9PROT|nr:amidase [Dongia rigui]MDY0872622.1 amidase [Dongia rigui]
MNRADYLAQDGLGLADLIRRRAVSADEVLVAAREVIAATNPETNAIVDLFANPAESNMDPAARFHGVPFLLKDIGGALNGARTTGASRYLAGLPPLDTDDALTARFKQAGLRILGKTNLPELGFNVTTEPAMFGPARNPWNLAHSTGGSSGGSAAAVAAGMVPLAHATDGAGSIRIPAAACGLVGLKPSRGSLPQGPAHADIYAGLVSEGVVSRSVRDTAAALDIAYGPDAGAPYGAPPAPIAGFLSALMQNGPRLKIGVNHQHLDDVALAPEGLAALETAAELLRGLGHHVAPIALPIKEHDLVLPRRVYKAQVCAQAAADAAELKTILGRPPHEGEMERINLAAAEAGRRMGAAEYVATIRAGQAFTRTMALLWDDIDVLLTPALAGPAPQLGAFPTDHDDVDLHVARMLRFSPFTATYNVTGEPAITLPIQQSADGLPLGIQLCAALGNDASLLVLAQEIETARVFALSPMLRRQGDL